MQPPETVMTPPRKRLNKWALASLLTFVIGQALIFMIVLIYAVVTVTLNPVTGDQAGWNLLFVVIAPMMAVKTYGVLIACASLILGIISLFKAKGSRNVLGIVMVVITGLMSLQLPRFLSLTLGMGS